MILYFLILNVQKAGKDLISSLYNIIYIYIYILRKPLIILLISITLWPFNGYQTFLILWLKISYKSGYLYIWKGKKKKDTFFNFELESCRLFKKQFFVLNTYHLLLLTTHKIFYLLQNFLGKESTIESLYPTSSVGSQG